MLKTQPIVPLETIYEESGSFTVSKIDIPNQLNKYEHPNEVINDLISAHSIPSVGIQRNRAIKCLQKPPIEVRFRDGSKRYIHPSTTTATTMNRRNLSDSSHDNLLSKQVLLSKYRPIFNTNLHTKNVQAKIPLVVTIITADDLNEAEITPTMSPSSDDSEISTSIETQSRSLTNNIRVIENIQQGLFEQLPTESIRSSVHTGVNSSTLNFYSPVILSEHTQQQQQQQQQFAINHHQNSASSNAAARLSSIPSAQPLNSSQKVTLTDDEKNKNLSLNTNPSYIVSSSDPFANETVSKENQPNTTFSVGDGIRSAFRPFHKSMHSNQQSLPIQAQVPLNVNENPYNSLQQQQIILYFQLLQQQHSSNAVQISLQAPSAKSRQSVPTYLYDSMMQTQTKIDAATKQLSNLNVSRQMNSSNYQQQLPPLSISTINNSDNSLPHLLNLSSNAKQIHSFSLNPYQKWFDVNSKSIYEILRLSRKFPNIPLSITLPVVSQTNNQELTIKHNNALEDRLLNAGLSPETVVLYERILRIAGKPQLLSSTKIVY